MVVVSQLTSWVVSVFRYYKFRTTELMLWTTDIFPASEILVAMLVWTLHLNHEKEEKVKEKLAFRKYSTLEY